MKKNTNVDAAEHQENRNMELYEKFRSVPSEFIKPILAGRLKGKSDINPMWRLKMLTEAFGPCGIGWRYEISDRWLERGDREVSAFVQINLFVKVDGKWSEAIPGIGGAPFITIERNGPYQSDECYKMALTDAISVSCKALGIAADIYYGRDPTKYTPERNASEQPQSGIQPDNRKPFPIDKVEDKEVMKWIYAQMLRARKDQHPFSISDLLNSNYLISAENINLVTDNFESYVINNNLPQ